MREAKASQWYAPRVEASRSKSRASLRKQAAQPKEPSTTQRRGSRTKRCLSPRKDSRHSLLKDRRGRFPEIFPRSKIRGVFRAVASSWMCGRVRGMFTGLVIETGTLLTLEPRGESARLTLRAPTVAHGSRLGDSIAVNGCCLTATAIEDDSVSFDLLAETLRRTSIGDVRPGGEVNLEPALGAGAKMGGHFVQGHVDTTAKLLDYSAHGNDHRLEVELPPEFAQYVVYKGSIAVDGISLTLAEVGEGSFTCWIIPHTDALTNLHTRKAGDRVNLEFDLLAKYVERMLAARLPA